MNNRILAVFLTLTLVASPIAGSAAAAPGLNFDSDKTPNPDVVEDELVVKNWDNGEMDSPLEYYNDSGEVASLPATVNQSQDTPVGVRFDQIDAEAYRLFPRIDGESENDATWAKAGDWTTSSGASSSVSVSDADADGVDKVLVDASVASSETATATFGANVSITSDPNERVLHTVLNVDQLNSGTVEIRAVDGGGDFRYASIDASASAATNESVIANSTGNGYVFAERLSELTLAGSGDGTFDGIQKVEVVAEDTDAEVTIAGLDLDKKSDYDLAEIERDTDGDGDLETTVIQEYYEGGVANLTGVDTLGSTFDNAVVNDLRVYDVQYQFADLTDEDEYSTNVTNADAYSYPKKLELYADLQVPSAIDLSHGTLTLEFDQGLITERYATLEVASGVDSSTAFGNVSDSSYTDKTGSLSGDDTTATLVAGASSDTNYRVHMVVLLQNEEVDTIQMSMAGGPTDSAGGGFFSTLFGQLTGLVGAALGAVGLKRAAGRIGGS